eukprot:218824-Amphidinium_carterae.1
MQKCSLQQPSPSTELCPCSFLRLHAFLGIRYKELLLQTMMKLHAHSTELTVQLCLAAQIAR